MLTLGVDMGQIVPLTPVESLKVVPITFQVVFLFLRGFFPKHFLMDVWIKSSETFHRHVRSWVKFVWTV